MSKTNRYDCNRKVVKEYLLDRCGNICLLCGIHYSKNKLTLHHTHTKWSNCHTTTIDNSALICEYCHQKVINEIENEDIEMYNDLNNLLDILRNNLIEETTLV